MAETKRTTPIRDQQPDANPHSGYDPETGEDLRDGELPNEQYGD